MWTAAKGCCSPDGHCKTKTPPKQNSGPECKQIAFNYQKSVDLHIDLPVIAVVVLDPPLRAFEPYAAWSGTNSVSPSPPDLQVLLSTFLI